ncbi:uncharacterized protein LOC127432698 [Myxocyprinus asiaticus]|uniref:uncharacterized protein LOC127432698 n=1 Tax=Myxocyprinus asiaticus TaxID=70543 RepID=UPI002223B827|nr:uncharacterized protein LOC127432698 [Myxocyprinus asiaticus]
MAVECTAYCFLCDDGTCCLQVFLELFPSGPGLLGYTSDDSSDSLVRNLVRSSCAWLVDDGVMLLPLADNGPNGAYWKIQKLLYQVVRSICPTLQNSGKCGRCYSEDFYLFGAPKRILTDQGRDFINELNKEVCKILGIERSLCAPYHPQTNELLEKLNGTIQRAQCKLVNQHPESWDMYLDAMMFGLRTKKHITTKFPLFGTEAHLQSEVPEDYKM